MRKSYVLLADGLSVVILRDDNSSFVISYSWRFLYTYGYLWDSSSKDLLMSFLTSSGVFSKKDTRSSVRYSAPEKYCECGVHHIGFCLSHPLRGGRGGVGSVTEQSRVKPREDKEVRELIPHTGPIPILIPLKLFLDLLRDPVSPKRLRNSQSYVMNFRCVDS